MNNRMTIERVIIVLMSITCYWSNVPLQAQVSNAINNPTWLSKKYSIIEDEKENLCSYYCAAIVARIYGRQTEGLEKLFLDASNKQSISAERLQKEIRSLGLYVKARKYKSGKIPSDHFWFIAYIHPRPARNGHFVLAKREPNVGVLVVDGEKTKVIPVNPFAKHNSYWRGEVLVISDNLFWLYEKEICWVSVCVFSMLLIIKFNLFSKWAKGAFRPLFQHSKK